MAIYHCSISNVSRAKGSSSCATLSYISGERVREDRTGLTYSFGRTERVLVVETVLPDRAPEQYGDPELLFNAIENHEKADNARTAKKIEVALPREFDLERQKEVVREYITENLTKEGYCATFAIHGDPDNNNPHAHILVANRQIDERGEWASKRKMDYALDERGKRIPRIDEETGLQKVDAHGRKQWVRINTEVNPLDKKDFLGQLREGWATACNKYLARDQQIDHRSYDAQGIDQIPTVHEGYAAQKIEKRGGVSEICEENRKIQERNDRLRQVQTDLKQNGEKLVAISAVARNVYDIAQPEQSGGLVLAPEHHAAACNALKKYAENELRCLVEFTEDISIGLHGQYKPLYGTIVINDRLKDTAKLSALTHELGHAITEPLCPDLKSAPDVLREIRADAYSIMLSTHLGLPVPDMRKNHLAQAWQDYKKLRDNHQDMPSFVDVLEQVYTVYQRNVELVDCYIHNEIQPNKEFQQQLALCRSRMERDSDPAEIYLPKYSATPIQQFQPRTRSRGYDLDR